MNLPHAMMSFADKGLHTDLKVMRLENVSLGHMFHANCKNSTCVGLKLFTQNFDEFFFEQGPPTLEEKNSSFYHKMVPYDLVSTWG